MKLAIIAGLPGTGKTHAATRLAAETSAVRLSRDEIRAELFHPVTYSVEEKASAFREMLVRAEGYLGSGRDVILEGMPFSRRSERDAARKLAEESAVEFELLHCVCPDEVALERIKSASAHLAGDRSEALFREVKSRFEPIGEDEGATVIRTSPCL